MRNWRLPVLGSSVSHFLFYKRITMKKEQGWIKLHRKLLDSDMWKCLSLKQKDIMITCLLLANHKSNQWEFDGKIYTVNPGEFITSYQNLAERCDKSVSISSVRTALAKLEKWNFLTRTSTSKSTKITICKWKTYQEKRTENRTITDKQTANEPQTNRKPMTTNKNDKECIKNEIRMNKKTIDPKLLSDALKSTPYDRKWNEWEKILMAIQGGELTGLTEENLIVLLQKSGLEPEETVYQSVLNSIPKVIATAEKI